MIDNLLKSERYYLDKVSMFMKSSYGIKEQYEVLITILSLVDDSIDKVLYFFDITNDNVFLAIEALGQDGSDILDKFAHLYGLKREFTLIYEEAGENHIEQVNLNNFELWMLIKAQILQNNYDGSFIQMRNYYDKMNIPVYIFTNVNSGQAQILLDTTSAISVGGVQYTYEDNPNLALLFKANYLTIRSMGIQYSTIVSSIVSLGVWDSTVLSKSWDNAEWGL